MDRGPKTDGLAAQRAPAIVVQHEVVVVADKHVLHSERACCLSIFR